MTASPIATSIKWSSVTVDISNLPNYTSETSTITDYDACGNTKKIIQSGDSSTYPAAWAAVNYSPTTAPATAGKWCLPTTGILNSLYMNLSAINITISKLWGRQLTGDNEHIWSSSECNSGHAWIFCTDSDLGIHSNGIVPSTKANDYKHVVRPVIEF